MSNPCTDVLSDSEYLRHMIPHHQVAIDMSEMLLPISKNPDVLHLCRNIIRNQRFTMNDIGKIKRRVEQLEYYATLSLLERETESLFRPMVK